MNLMNLTRAELDRLVKLQAALDELRTPGYMILDGFERGHVGRKREEVTAMHRDLDRVEKTVNTLSRAVAVLLEAEIARSTA